MNGNTQNEALFLQYTGTPTQGHEDLIQTLVSPPSSSNFKMPANRANVHINPRFQANLVEGTVPGGGGAITRTSPLSSPKKGGHHTVHVNPRFANRPLPSLPSRAELTATGSNSEAAASRIYQNAASCHVYANSGLEHVYQNMVSSTSLPLYQNTSSHYSVPSTTLAISQPPYQNIAHKGKEEPIYSTVGHGLPLDSVKQEQFIQSIHQSIQAQVPGSLHQATSVSQTSSGHVTTRASSGPHHQSQLTASNGVVLRNKYKKDNRVNPPNKPVRNSIAARPARNSVIEKPKRYSLMVEKPKRHSVYVVDNRKPSKPARKSLALTESTVPETTPIVPVMTATSSLSSTPAIIVSSTPAQAVPSSSAKLTTPVSKRDEKENLPSTTKKNFLFTPLRKTPFKKIGTRKLIRVKKKSLSPGTPKPSFKRIGNTKLIRIRESLTNNDKSTPSSVYSIKTKSKIVKKVKNTPSNTSKFRFSFITPLSVRKNRIVRQTSSKNIAKKSSFTSRFKLDRREKKERTINKKTSQTRLKKLGTGTYHVSATKLQKVGASAPAKPARTRNISIYRPKATALNPNIAPNKVITVQGIKFAVADNGRKLKRLASDSDLGSSSVPSTVTYSASVSHTSPGQSQTSPGGLTASSPATTTTQAGVSSSPGGQASPSPGKLKVSPRKLPPPVESLNTKRTYIGGEEFEEIEPGVFTRSRHSLTRQSITQAKARSINTILKVQNRSKQYCMFFNKFGKCTKKDKGTCPYIHDASKIAVCRRFLQGACTKDACLLSHQLDADKMPACKYFLEGVCTRDNCPYLHVKLSDKAGVCERFLKGFCPNGADCSQRHVIACPEFHKTGTCSRKDKCGFPHISSKLPSNQQTDTDSKKKVPPTKPKRKSLGPSEANTKKSRVGSNTARYFNDPSQHPDQDQDPELNPEPNVPGSSLEAGRTDIEERRRRILKKIEQAKQAWRSSMLGETADRPDEEVDTSGVETAPDLAVADRLADETEVGEESVEDRGSDNRLSSAPRRPPIGKLEDFISLETSEASDQNICNDRLI